MAMCETACGECPDCWPVVVADLLRQRDVCETEWKASDRALRMEATAADQARRERDAKVEECARREQAFRALDGEVGTLREECAALRARLDEAMRLAKRVAVATGTLTGDLQRDARALIAATPAGPVPTKPVRCGHGRPIEMCPYCLGFAATPAGPPLLCCVRFDHEPMQPVSPGVWQGNLPKVCELVRGHDGPHAAPKLEETRRAATPAGPGTGEEGKL